ncbi:phospholipase D-like domain-containing protein [Palleronia sp. LCG004]|uniref:phospholipase D-like domain-containing protein n=1 Tax=Palleronia sp. LCG004 TaxID=3079304 RepID=UPI0029420ABB|nr:phospholipase D-like domain-containing protein [Palleronia sp. LCG004]WOI56009.1 phospholipase D-like domain-containing protein [Palleronia sp. LCG004]
MTPQLLLTAEEAYPAFERAALGASDRIVMGFRIFDPMTKLRSEEACEIGDDWVDFMVHLLRKGIDIDLTLSDFDPIVSPEMHELTWASIRKTCAIAELAGDAGKRLQVRADMHPARVGWMTASMLWPRVRSELTEIREILNDLDPAIRHARFRDLPGLTSWLKLNDDGFVEQYAGGPFPLHPVSHHQKLAVIDGRILYIGGLDLNPRRYDTPRHHRPGEETWHDIQLMIEGPVAEAAEAHLRRFSEASRAKAPPPEQRDGLRLTMSVGREDPVVAFGPEPTCSGLNDALVEGVRSARKLLYFETQFFRDQALAEIIAEAGRADPDLEVLFILPAAPEDVAFDNRTKVDARFGEYLQAACVDKVNEAFGGRAFFASPAQPREAPLDKRDTRACFHGSPLIYVHAKLAIFDRRSVLVSSANMNSRSLHWDTEAGVLVEDEEFARHALGRALGHWCRDRQPDFDAPLVPQIRDLAEIDAVRQPENRETYLLPYDVEVAREFGTYLPGIPDELV